MKKVVITGATSFIGVHLINEWLKYSCKIYAVVRPNSEKRNRLPDVDCIEIIDLEMEDYIQLSKYIEQADVFYHLAWEGARMPQREDADMQRKNYLCAVEAMKVAHELGCEVFVGAGSQAEYGMMKGYVDENYPCNPVTEYGREKLHACNTLMNMAKDYDIRFVWLRIFSIYGKYDYSGSLIMSSIKKMRENEIIQLTACTQKWDYLHVNDLVNAMRGIAENEEAYGIFNIASGTSKVLKEYVEIIKEVVQSESEIQYGVIPYGKEGAIDLLPCVDRLNNIIGWFPKMDFYEGIQDII